METLPAEGDEAAAKAVANECFQAALDEDIPAAEIQEAFDDLAEFIAGEIEEAREGKKDFRTTKATKSCCGKWRTKRVTRTKTKNNMRWSASFHSNSLASSCAPGCSKADTTLSKADFPPAAASFDHLVGAAK